MKDQQHSQEEDYNILGKFEQKIEVKKLPGNQESIEQGSQVYNN